MGNKRALWKKKTAKNGPAKAPAKRAASANTCPVFAACRRFVHNKLRLPAQTFNPEHDICYCNHCAAQDADRYYRGGNPYLVPKGWCGFSLAVDDHAFTRSEVWDKWHVAYHGTTMETAKNILDSPEWQLLQPGDKTPKGFEIPIRQGHITRSFERTNRHTNATEHFDPGRQVFTSPSIKYCAYGTEAQGAHRGVYCDIVEFEGHRFCVAFQVRQQPSTYCIGQQTVGASEQIDPMVSNDSLEFYTERRGVIKLQRLMVRVLDDHEIARVAAEKEAVRVAGIAAGTDEEVRAAAEAQAVSPEDVGRLGRFLPRRLTRDATDAASLAGDALRGRYRPLAWPAVLALTGALAYLISPADAIPDAIPVAGHVDDVAVLTGALAPACIISAAVCVVFMQRPLHACIRSRRAA